MGFCSYIPEEEEMSFINNVQKNKPKLSPPPRAANGDVYGSAVVGCPLSKVVRLMPEVKLEPESLSIDVSIVLVNKVPIPKNNNLNNHH